MCQNGQIGNVDPKSLEDLMEDVPVFVAEREDGKTERCI